MFSHLSGVEGLIRHAEDVGVVLLLAHDELPEIDRASDGRCIALVNTHAVNVTVVSDAPHVLDFRHVGKEAHPLQPAVPEGLVHCDHNLETSELVEDGPKHVHPRVLPEAAAVVKQLVPDYISHSRQLVVRTLFVER